MKKLKFYLLIFLITILSGCTQMNYFGGPGSGDEMPAEGEPTGPGSGDEVPNEPTGPGSGDEVPNEPTGPGSGDEVEVNSEAEGSEGPGSGDTVENTEPTGPGSGDEVPNEPTGPGSGDEVPNEPTGPGSGDEVPNEPTGPGSGDEVPNEPTGPGSGDEVDPNEPTGPGSGDEMPNDDEPTGPGSGDEEPTGPGSGDEISQSEEFKLKAKSSCNAIARASTCVEYIGSFWDFLQNTTLNCTGAGAHSTEPCPRPTVGGCNVSPGTVNEVVIWHYNYGGDPFTPGVVPYAAGACNANPMGNWVFGN